MTRSILISITVAALAGAGAWFWLRPAPPVTSVALSALGPPDIAAGEILYQQSCAVCHGVNLEGQPDWRSPGPDGRLPAPPHDETGHTWHHGDDLLFRYTKLGGAETLAAQGVEYESGMPAFGDILSDKEIMDIIAYIKSTWPDRQREMQAARTEAERLQKEGN